MGKKKTKEAAESTVAPVASEPPDPHALNAYLRDESASDEDVEDLTEFVVDRELSVTALLDAVAAYVGEQDDEIGRTMLREFRVRYAAHEVELGEGPGEDEEEDEEEVEEEEEEEEEEEVAAAEG